jgi:prepilin-type N-terminal cleavage/methylation domain-containing protein
MRPAEPCRASSTWAWTAGYTLAELLVALTLLAALATVLFGALIAHVRLARQLAHRVVEADAVRTASTVIGGELRRASPLDLRAVASDSLALRAFRGIGTVCGATSDAIVLHYRGDREPAPAKDSVLWIGSGVLVAARLAAVQPFGAANCTGVADGEVQLWRTEPAVPAQGVLLVYESGTYYLTGGALRYRIGEAGRQPLTPELFIRPPSGFFLRSPDAVEYRLGLATVPAAPVLASVHYPLRR